MRALGLLALAGGLVCSGCAKPGLADPTPVLANQSELASIRQAITPCLRKTWASQPNGRSTRLTLRWRLDEDGMLVDDPEIIDPRDGSASSPAAQLAIRAVQACEPFRLPIDKYHLWKEIVFNFDAL